MKLGTNQKKNWNRLKFWCEKKEVVGHNLKKTTTLVRLFMARPSPPWLFMGSGPLHLVTGSKTLLTSTNMIPGAYSTLNFRSDHMKNYSFKKFQRVICPYCMSDAVCMNTAFCQFYILSRKNRCIDRNNVILKLQYCTFRTNIFFVIL